MSPQTAFCADDGLGGASCSGLNELGNGLLQATFSAKGAQVSVSGSFVSPTGIARPATGRLTWAGELSLTLVSPNLPQEKGWPTAVYLLCPLNSRFARNSDESSAAMTAPDAAYNQS